MRRSRNLEPEIWETAPKQLTRIGALTEASERIVFVREVCPTCASCVQVGAGLLRRTERLYARLFRPNRVLTVLVPWG